MFGIKLSPKNSLQGVKLDRPDRIHQSKTTEKTPEKFSKPTEDKVSLSSEALEAILPERRKPKFEPDPNPNPNPRSERNTLENFVERLNDGRRTLAENFLAVAGDDGVIDIQDLEKAATDPSLSTDARRAIILIRDSETVRNMFDTGAGQGDVDGQIGATDLRSLPTFFSSDDAGLEGLREQFAFLADSADGKGGRDGVIGHSDASAIATDSFLPPELREAFSRGSF